MDNLITTQHSICISIKSSASIDRPRYTRMKNRNNSAGTSCRG